MQQRWAGDGAMTKCMERRREVVTDPANARALGSNMEGVARSTTGRQDRNSMGTRAHAQGR